MSNQNHSPLALIGENQHSFIKQGLIENGFNVITLPADERLAPQVATHADMLLLKLDKTIFCNKDYYEKNITVFNLIKEYGYTIKPSNFNVSSEYPNDVSLNQAVIGNQIFGRKDSCANSVIDYAGKYGYTYHSIKQGYAKCSTLIITPNAIISADSGIISLANRLGINALKINNGASEITLDGYDYGFIGGASVAFCDKVFFFGDISLHSQASEIVSFCKSNGATPISLSQERLCDIGGAIILPYIGKK